MSTTATPPQKNSSTSDFVCSTIPWEQVNEPGAYICNWSGHLLRIPEDGVASGRSPVLNIVGSEPLFVTKISDNPFITITKAKLLAANWDVDVNF